jgi:hypothetical protein
MRKHLALLAAVVATGVLAGTASGSGPLFTESGFACGIATHDGGFTLTTNSVVTWYSSGKVVLRCEGTVPNPTGSRLEFSGFLCGLGPFGFTTDSRNTIGHNGSSQLTCVGFADPTAPARIASTGGYGRG